MKRIPIVIVLVIAVFVFVSSCKDEFSEEDFLRQQHNLRLKQDAARRSRDSTEVDYYSKESITTYIAALNEAGDLLSVTFMIRENGNPLEGVNVSLTTGPAGSVANNGRVNGNQVGQTDEFGSVTFERVVIGVSTVTFLKEGYLTATAVVNFGLPSPPVPIQVEGPNGMMTRYVPPQKRNESGIIPMFSFEESNENTAIIKGRATIETDVTNLTPEIPVGQTIRANLAGIGNNLGLPPFVSSFAFADHNDLGVATILPDGSYTMRVPATAAGQNISFIIPNIYGERKTALNGYDDGTGTPVAFVSGPEIYHVPAVWGPEAVGVSTVIPEVAGARVNISIAPPVGTGVDFDYVPVPRSIPGLYVSDHVGYFNDGVFARFKNKGNYGNSLKRPTVQITGGGGLGATADVVLRTFVQNITVLNAGSNYENEALIIMRGTRANGTTLDIAFAYVETINGSLPAVIDLDEVDGVFGAFGEDDGSILLNDPGERDLISVSLVVEAPQPGGVQAQVTGTFLTFLGQFEVFNGGLGYTSAPSITLTDGAPGVDVGEIEIAEFQTQWEIEVDNAKSKNYLTTPEAIAILYNATHFTSNSADNIVDIVSENGAMESANVDINDAFTVSEGKIVPTRGSGKIVTNLRSSIVPSIQVTPRAPQSASAAILSASIDDQTGEILDISLVHTGNAYHQPITATIAPAVPGAPGSGASIQLNNSYNPTTKEWTWNGTSVITSGGSGYLPNVNLKGEQSAQFPPPVNVQAGKTYIVDFRFGTGVNLVQIN